jgi:hypothetical protein
MIYTQPPRSTFELFSKNNPASISTSGYSGIVIARQRSSAANNSTKTPKAANVPRWRPSFNRSKSKKNKNGDGRVFETA